MNEVGILDGSDFPKKNSLKSGKLEPSPFPTENNTECCGSAFLGKYGRAMLNYIKTHKRGLYAELLMNGTLNKHLAEIDRTATERINRIIKAMAEQDNTNEQLKETNQLLWVGLMNNYKHSAEEIVYNDIIFA